MRTTGLTLLVGGLFAFFYCSTRLSGLDPLPAGLELGDYMQYEARKWELARYGAALTALIGVLLSRFPRGSGDLRPATQSSPSAPPRDWEQ